jgi:hypothetical protein
MFYANSHLEAISAYSSLERIPSPEAPQFDKSRDGENIFLTVLRQRRNEL